MCGSKKEWQTYLGLEDQKARSTWTELRLKSPPEYVRALDNDTLLLSLARHDSVAKAAEHYGVSETFLKGELKARVPNLKPEQPKWTVEQCVEHFETYRSVTLVARITQTTETQVRKAVNELGLEISTLIDYSFGGNSNAKGRRAELQWAEMRGTKILADRNIEDGSQANYDFDDVEFGRVNVKSSRMYKYRARTRAADPFFWKISTNGSEKCDYFACLCYDHDMQRLIGDIMIPVHKLPATKSLIIYGKDLNGLRASDVSK